MQIALGTWQSAPSHGFWADQDTRLSEKTILRALELGITCFDCAQSYGSGRAEQMLGKILCRRAAAQGSASAPGPAPVSVDTKIMPTTRPVRDVVMTSLARLKTGQINCLYLHWPSSRINWEENLKQMQLLKEEGLVRKIGVCNLTPAQLEEVADSFEINCFQRPLSLIWSRGYGQVRDFCTRRGIELVAYSPLGMGILSGKYSSPARFSPSDPRRSLFCFDPACIDSLHALLSDITMDDALLWTKAKKPDVLLLGARSPSQIEQDIAILAQDQNPERTAFLDGLARRFSDASESVCDNMFSYRW